MEYNNGRKDREFYSDSCADGCMRIQVFDSIARTQVAEKDFLDQLKERLNEECKKDCSHMKNAIDSAVEAITA